MLIVTVILALVGWQLSEGCMCSYKHVQQGYCDSPLVIVAIPTEVSEGLGMKTYDIEIKNVLKATPQARIALDSKKIQTTNTSTACGVKLQLNQPYVIVGSLYKESPFMNSCQFIDLWEEITVHQKNGFETLYEEDCKRCKINMCRNCKKTSDTCVLSFPNNGCHDKYSSCTVDSNDECNWTQSTLLSECLDKSI